MKHFFQSTSFNPDHSSLLISEPEANEVFFAYFLFQKKVSGGPKSVSYTHLDGYKRQAEGDTVYEYAADGKLLYQVSLTRPEENAALFMIQFQQDAVFALYTCTTLTEEKTEISYLMQCCTSEGLSLIHISFGRSCGNPERNRDPER